MLLPLYDSPTDTINEIPLQYHGLPLTTLQAHRPSSVVLDTKPKSLPLPFLPPTHQSLIESQCPELLPYFAHLWREDVGRYLTLFSLLEQNAIP